MSAPDRPILRWHGGKWLLAQWILQYFPPHRVYVEPFGGAASVLLQKKRSYSEVYNDLDGDVVNLFRVLQHPKHSRELHRKLIVTPFARAEFELAYQKSRSPVETARRLIIRSFMGFGSDGSLRISRTGFRANSNRSGTTPAHDWVNYPTALVQIIERFAGVVVEQRPAAAIMRQHDDPEALHYLDPPYLPETRQQPGKHRYAFEMSVSDHEDMLSLIRDLKGMVILSGYHSKLYDRVLAKWKRVEKKTYADGALKRVEVLWINERASKSLRGRFF